jgi:hypothetical protein
MESMFKLASWREVPEARRSHVSMDVEIASPPRGSQ